jgi:dynein heavy chain
MPPQDSPVIFGLHTNADLTYRMQESKAMISTLLETQPKDAGGGSGKSREEEVKDKIQKELIQLLPPDFIPADVDERLEVLKGPKGLSDKGKGIPLNIFLMQEIQRFQRVLGIVRTMMVAMVDAIEGTVIMTPDLVDAINAVFDFRVPTPWQFDATGVEISWLVPSLSSWIQGLIARHYQLNSWLMKERPPSFWLTGFFNPQGFLTSMKQEVTRMNKDKQWSLDDVDYKNDVKREVITTEDGKVDKVLTAPAQGVLIHGLFMEGAGWNKGETRLQDSTPKELFFTFPVIHVTAESLTPT